MDVAQAARNTNILWLKTGRPIPEPEKTTHGTTEAHCRFVLLEVANGDVHDDKAHRWLGWAQGWLVARDILTLDDCKYANVFA